MGGETSTTGRNPVVTVKSVIDLYFQATWHRVVYGNGDADRYSWPFFFGLTPDAVLEQLPEYKYNKDKMEMLPGKQPTEHQTFIEWFLENVTAVDDIVDSSGILWRMVLRDGPSDISEILGVEF